MSTPRLPRTPSSLLLAALLLAALAVHAHALSRVWALTVDDAYITLRYARNIVEGHGFVYNPGGPVVEGFSNPLLLLWQVIAYALGFGRTIVATKVLGVLSSMAMLLATAGLAADLLRWTLPQEELRQRVLPVVALGPALLAGSLSIACIAVMGLEGSLFGMLLTIGGWMAMRVLRGEGGLLASIAGGVALGLACWTRPEGIAWALAVPTAVVGIRAIERQPLRPALVLAAGAIGLWLALIALRLAIFGYPQPNTYYAKMAGEAMPRMQSALGYLADWMRDHGGWAWWALGIFGVVLADRSGRREALLLLAAAAGHLAVVVWMGGDWMPGLRFIGPGLAPIAALAAVGTALLLVRVARSWALARAVSVAGVLTVGLAWGAVRLARPGIIWTLSEAQVRTWGWADGHLALAEWLAEWNLMRDEPLTVAIEDIGIVGWVSRVEILDLAGLVDPVWAHLVYEHGIDVPYPADRVLLEIRPEVIVLVSTRRTAAGDHYITWKTNRELLVHPEFAERYRMHVSFAHKDYPQDGYYLTAFLRRDLDEDIPRARVPMPRARGGWDE
ncbi:MAG: hypothetical protein KF858_12425 [Candidatus Sumerlaeia bacterium]|nr:hypothetical protein [Candidatus Sumerlaeia bacterium]